MYYHRTVIDLRFSVRELALKFIMVYEKNKYRNNLYSKIKLKTVILQ